MCVGLTQIAQGRCFNAMRTTGESGATQRHLLRRSLVSGLLNAGADPVTEPKLSGQASVTTTARYDRRGEEIKRRAVGLLHVPYRGRKA